MKTTNSQHLHLNGTPADPGISGPGFFSIVIEKGMAGLGDVLIHHRRAFRAKSGFAVNNAREEVRELESELDRAEAEMKDRVSERDGTARSVKVRPRKRPLGWTAFAVVKAVIFFAASIGMTIVAIASTARAMERMGFVDSLNEGMLFVGPLLVGLSCVQKGMVFSLCDRATRRFMMTAGVLAGSIIIAWIVLFGAANGAALYSPAPVLFGPPPEPASPLLGIALMVTSILGESLAGGFLFLVGSRIVEERENVGTKRNPVWRLLDREIRQMAKALRPQRDELNLKRSAVEIHEKQERAYLGDVEAHFRAAVVRHRLGLQLAADLGLSGSSDPQPEPEAPLFNDRFN